MKRIFVFAVLALAALAPLSSSAQEQRIVAVVNDDVISNFDIDSRIGLMMIGAGPADTPDTRTRLRPQILRQLIDERIQMQEARRLGLAVPKSELDATVRRIEQGNNLPQGGLERVMRQAGVPLVALERQIEASQSWQRVVNARLRPQVEVGRDEVEEVLRRYRTGEPVREYLLSEIFLAVDQPDQESEVRERMADIVAQLRRGVAFAVLAQQYSQAASAGEQGDIGWVERDTLDAEVSDAVANGQVGQLVGPVRVASGFYLYALRETRTIAPATPDDARVDLAQLVFPAASPEERDAAKALAEMVRETVQGCADLNRVASEAKIPEPQRVSELRIGDLAPDMRARVKDLGVGDATDVFQTDRGEALAMVCVRTEAPSNVPTESDIEDNLGRQRVENAARRYLRDLRRIAVVDVRA
jgi:peptidyl-prolyl cis-trans isomerase SurA